MNRKILFIFIIFLILSTIYSCAEEILVEDETIPKTKSQPQQSQPQQSESVSKEPTPNRYYDNFNDDFGDFSFSRIPLFRNSLKRTLPKYSRDQRGIFSPFHDFNEIYSLRDYLERQKSRLESFWENQMKEFYEIEKYFNDIFPLHSSKQTENQKLDQSKNKKEEMPIATTSETNSNLSIIENLESMINVAIDVAEKEKSYVIVAETPGISKENLKIELFDQNQNHVLKLSGSRKSRFETEDPSTKIHRFESRQGSFQRMITLPNNIDVDDLNKIQTNFKDGILSIEIPKKESLPQEQKQPKIININ